eukprot:560202-Pyramimonas_sp.AAC.1
MQTESEASLSDAQLMASDLADEVRHLWLASGENHRAAQGGSAAAGCREISPVHLGGLRVIVDTCRGLTSLRRGFFELQAPWA